MSQEKIIKRIKGFKTNNEKALIELTKTLFSIGNNPDWQVKTLKALVHIIETQNYIDNEIRAGIAAHIQKLKKAKKS